MSSGSLSGRGYGLQRTDTFAATYLEGLQDGTAATRDEYRQFIDDLLTDLERLADKSKNADRPPYAWEMIGNVERFAAHWRIVAASDGMGDL